jgi:hypothetical protein
MRVEERFIDLSAGVLTWEDDFPVISQDLSICGEGLFIVSLIASLVEREQNTTKLKTKFTTKITTS